MLTDPEALALLASWRAALADRRALSPDRHGWANAEMAVRYWRLVASDTRAARPRAPRTGTTANARPLVEA